jgi:hypothetical protein
MLTRPGMVGLAVASLVGVVGWPVLVVVARAWLREPQMADPMWWAAGGVLATVAWLQLELNRRLWRYVGPRS